VVLLVLTSCLVALYVEVSSPDQVMMCGLVVVWHLGIITTQQAFAGFSNPSVITIGSLFVVVRAVDRSKVVNKLTRGLLGSETSQFSALLRLCTAGMALSGFLNNTPLVALLIPIVRDWARGRGFAASKFLLPLSYSTIMGGSLTVIGSSTNLVINGLLEQMGHEPFGFFEPALVALPVGMVGLAYLVCVVPPLLPGDRGGLFRALREHVEDMVTELELTHEFPELGSNVFGILQNLGIEKDALVKILRTSVKGESVMRKSALSTEEADVWGAERSFRRFSSWGGDDQPAEPINLNPNRTEIFPVPAHEQAQEGDVFVLSLGQETLTALVAARPKGLQVRSLHPLEIAGNDKFIEVVLAPESPVVGGRLSKGSELFKSHYGHLGVSLIAVRCRQAQANAAEPVGRRISSGMVNVPSFTPSRMRASSMPLLYSTSENSFLLKRGATDLSGQMPGEPLETLQMTLQRSISREHCGQNEAGRFASGDVALLLAPSSQKLPMRDFLLVTEIADLPQPTNWYDYVPLAAFGVGLLLTIFAGVNMARVALTLSVGCVLGGWIPPREVREAVDWNLLMLIGSALGLAQAVQSSGLSGEAAKLVLHAGLSPAGSVALLFLLVMVVTELVTNNAAAALGLPLAIDLAEALGMSSPRPLAMAVMLAASTSYACPIGYATNLMVLGPGGYSFGDFLRVGLIMDLIYLVGCSIVLPLVWPLD